MQHEARIQQRAPRPYVAIPAHVATEAEFRQAADRGFPELFGWLQEHGVQPSGPLFIRYLMVDEDGGPREIEFAVPVGPGVSGAGRVRADVLPAGRYVTLLHVGPYTSTAVPDLAAARAALQDWTDGQGIVLDRRDMDGGSALARCVEHYIIGPAEEPDHTKWETVLAYLVAEST